MYDRKPNCSYNCLIGMALKSSESGRLPVGEIYRFFEREFPYFLSAPEPWKNSLRHSLSLGHYFRKYNSDKLVTKKGHLWEVNPQRTAELDKEIYMFLARGIPDNVPRSPQLSKLRLQMTQLLLDSIKSTPSSSSSRNYRQHHHSPVYPVGHLQPASMSYTPQQAQQGISQAFMIAPPAPLFTNDGQRAMMYSAAPSPGGGGMGCLLASTPTRQPSMSPQQTRQPSMSPQQPFTPQAIYSIAAEAPLPAPLEGFNHHAGLEREGADSAKVVGGPCEDEAYQLVHFDGDQCFFGLEDGTLQDLAVLYSCQNDPIPVVMPTNEQPSATQQLHDLGQPTENQWKESYYPFITPPTAESDVALARLNGYNTYWFDQGPPHEMTITKCKHKPKTAASREGKVMDEAVRPIVHSWDAQWEVEKVICVLNDEAFMNFTEHWGEEDFNLLLSESKQNLESNITVVAPCENTPDVSDGMAASIVVKQPASNTPKRRRPYKGRRGYSSARKLRLQKCSLSNAVKKENTKKVPGKTHNEVAVAKRTKAAGEDELQQHPMIVSIPFDKLITERQKKKYCGQGGKSGGGKYRIPTKW